MTFIHIIGGIVTILMGICGVFIPAIMHFEEGRTAVHPPLPKAPALPPAELTGELNVTASQPAPIKVDCT